MKWYIWAGIGVVVLVIIIIVTKKKSSSALASAQVASGFDPYKLTQIV